MGVIGLLVLYLRFYAKVYYYLRPRSKKNAAILNGHSQVKASMRP